MYMKNVYLEYKCPRWEDFPEIGLYMDQVVSVLENNLEIFSRNEKIITPAMINNYVKQKIVKPPIKKKYDRVHLAYLYVVCMLKRFMPIGQICDGMAFVLKKYKIPQAYNLFCDEVEDAIIGIFEGVKASSNENKCPEDLIIRSVARAVGNLTYANYMIGNTKNETE